jgi:lycopene cyclase CruA
MKELIYLEVPTPNTDSVRDWLQAEFAPKIGEKVSTLSGCRLRISANTTSDAAIPENLPKELAIFVWSEYFP